METRVILLAICLLTGCAGTSVDVERSFRECLLNGGSAIYIVTKDMQRMECKR